jgi:hypothetical protein
VGSGRRDAPHDTRLAVGCIDPCRRFSSHLGDDLDRLVTDERQTLDDIRRFVTEIDQTVTFIRRRRWFLHQSRFVSSQPVTDIRRRGFVFRGTCCDSRGSLIFIGRRRLNLERSVIFFDRRRPYSIDDEEIF